MNEKELKSEENEILSETDKKVSQLCAGLKRVNAPKDFDFRLKARIAAHQPPPQKSPVFAFLRFAAPLALVLAVLGAVVSNNLYPIENTAVSPIALNYTEMPKTEETFIAPQETPLPFIASNGGSNADFSNEMPQVVSVSNQTSSQSFSMTNRSLRRNVGTSKNEPLPSNQGSSRDSALSLANVITPQTFNANRQIETPNPNNNRTSLSVRDILSQIGINAVFTGNGWKVQSVSQSSVAERSNIKAGDVIEAVNNIKLLSENLQTGLINGTILTVVRDNVRIEVVLR